MPVRILGGFLGPGVEDGEFRSREQKRGCPLRCREHLGKRLWGRVKFKVTIVLSWGVGRRRSDFLACSVSSAYPRRTGGIPLVPGVLNPQPGLGDFRAWAGVQPPPHSPGSFPSQGHAQATSSSQQPLTVPATFSS